VRNLTLTPGIRADWWSLTGQSTTSPWLQGEWRVANGTRFRAGAGEYQQFADFDQVLGLSGGTNLVPERATQYDAGVEQRFAHDTMRISVALYDREERDMLRRFGSEVRLVGTRIVRGSAASRYENRLDGHARGVELMLQRSGAERLSGWVSYAYAKAEYTDVVSGEQFWSDFDQRHTINACAVYRASARASYVAKLRVGSNFPIPGYYAERDDVYYVTDARNGERLPIYARLDLRANRTFAWSSSRMTLFAEIINVLNRANVRFNPPGVNLATRQTSNPFDSMLPIVPSAGVLIEF
jgi:outer membrane receptor protein involved in Fe transport